MTNYKKLSRQKPLSTLKHAFKSSNLNVTKNIACFALLLIMPILLSAQTTVNSVVELLPYLKLDDANVKLAEGTYSINAQDISDGTYGTPILLFEGSNSTYDFTGVTINFNTNLFNAFGKNEVVEIQITGNNNVLKNLTMVDEGSKYDRPSGTALGVLMDGISNRVEGFHMTVRGSYPYGYGDSFGKGSGSVIKHTKHSAVLVRGTSNHLLNATIIQRSYGHVVFMQGAVDALIEGCYIEAEMRSTDDMLAETSGPAFDVDFNTVWGYKLPSGYVKSLCEAGIRAYTSGITIINGEEIDRNTSDPTVRNCTIKGVRAAITLSQASGVETIENCTAIENERGFAMENGVIINSRSDAKYGSALSVDSNSGITADITILDYEGEEQNGSKNVAFISGANHDITLRSEVSNPDQDLKIEISADFRDVGNLDVVNVLPANGIKINNQTNYPLILSSESSNCTGVSGGMVTDLGVNNSINHTDVSITKIEAEEYSDMFGVTTETTTDTDNGDNVTGINSGDWLEYQIDVPFNGTYLMSYRVASATTNGDFTVSVGEETLEHVSFDATGGNQVWTTVQSVSAFHLTKGVQTIKVLANNGDWNFNWMDLLMQCADTPIKPFVNELNALNESLGKQQSNSLTVFEGNTAILDPEPLVGGQWSWTGPNGFAATTRVVTLPNIAQNQSGAYQVVFTNDCGLESVDTFMVEIQDAIVIEAEDYSNMSDVTVEDTDDVSGESNVTGIGVNDWLEYVIDVPYSANYILDYRVASASDSGDFDVLIDGFEVENITFDATGGPQSWTTVSSKSPIYIKEGSRTIRIQSNSEGWKLNWLKLNAGELIRPCDLPVNNEGFAVKNTTTDWSSGLIDISCESKVNFYVTAKSSGALDDSDYLNIYYRLDGGDLVTVSENNGSIDDMLVTAEGLEGDLLEVIIQSQSGSKNAYYTLENLVILNAPDPFAILQAENADAALNLRTEETSDVGGGLNAGWIATGDWFMFSNLNLTEVKSMEARVSSANSNVSIEVRIGAFDGDLIGVIKVPNTAGYQNWETAITGIDDTIGLHDVYFVCNGSFNINWFRPSSAEFVSVVDPLARIEAEDFDLSSGTETEASSDVDGGSNVGRIANDNWLKFNGLDLTNIKSIDARLASKYDVNTSFVEIRIDDVDGDLIGNLNVPGTGDWQAWETMSTHINSVSGIHDVYFVFKGESKYLFNFNWFQFSTTLGVNDELKTIFKVYPNPIQDVLHIDKGMGAKVSVYDSLGKLILSKELSSDQSTINTSSLNSGLYFVRLEKDNGVEYKKIIKQ